MTGLVFAKLPIVEAPTAMDMIINDITLTRMHIDDLATELVREVLQVGRAGLLIDMPKSPSDALTKAQVEALNIRPYMRMYKSETIINWREVLINNVLTLDMVILREEDTRWLNEYESETETIYRVLILRDGVYTQEIFRSNGKKEWEKDAEIIIPMMNGKTLNFIPFVAITPDKLTINPQKPPMLDIAVVNLSHFKLAVDHSHGMHFTALPTANFFVGNMPRDTTIKLGASTANIFNDPNGHAEYLEFTGSGLTTISNEKDTLVKRMASLGARFLSDDKKVAETAESMETRSSGERAILISATATISWGITKALEIMAKWMNISGDISYRLNQDYNLTKIDASFLKEMVVGNVTGAITNKMLYDTLVDGEIIKNGDKYTFDEYMADRDAMSEIVPIGTAQ